jgi:hypothetical protein
VGLAAGTLEMPTSVSIGLVSCPEDGTTADELMISADRAMYQAKSLGKNQVSGNPRPRRLLHRAPEEHAAVAAARVSAIPVMPAAPTATTTEPAPEVAPQVDAAVAPAHEPTPDTEPTPVAEPAAMAQSTSPDEGEPAAHPVEAAAPARPAMAGAVVHADGAEEEEPDPSEVRRHIAAASRNLDPDYQIRRAMDAFLSPTRPNGDRG